MTRRGVISIHDYPEHLNPFREDDEELHWKYNRKERVSLTVSSRLGSPSQSPAKPERPPLPHRTRLKDKENEVASPDEDKYFRQGAKPKKKRPAPMPPSPNQQKMTPAVSDASLDSSASSSSPNVTEVPESAGSSETKGHDQSPQKQSMQESAKVGDTASENGKPREDDANLRSDDTESSPGESKPQSDHHEQPTPVDTKPNADETKLETDGGKSQSEETGTNSEGSKSNGEETMPSAEDTKQLDGDGASQPDEKEEPAEKITPPSDADAPSQNAKTEDANRIRDEVAPPTTDGTDSREDEALTPADDAKHREGGNEEVSSEDCAEQRSKEGENVASADHAQLQSKE